jgi:hypothetical protein
MSATIAAMCISATGCSGQSRYDSVADCAAVMGAVSIDRSRRKESVAPAMLYATKRAGDALQIEGSKIGMTQSQIADDALERMKTFMNGGMNGSEIKQFETCYRKLELDKV